MFPWKTVFTISTANNRPKYLQIADQFIKEISSGRLVSGQKIPGSRKLSMLLTVNRKTVINAYDELLAQGWVVSNKSSGTYIAEDLPILQSNPLHSFQLKENGENRLINDDLSFIPEYMSPTTRLRVDGGSPDARLAPLDWIYKECKYLNNSAHGKRLFNYSDTKGEETLRKTLTTYLARTRGLRPTINNLLITRGSQMGIYLVINILLSNNDIAVVGDSSYDAADWAIIQAGAKMERIKVDNYGMDIDELEKLCCDQKIQLVYISPHHHFPTTVTLSNSRRIQLLNLASKYDFYILEDDYDYDFHYASSPILPLASFNADGRVIYVGSFSKIYAPSIRVGYLVANERLITEMSKLRRIIDRQGDHILQRAIAESITSGELDRHIKKSLLIYRNRRDHLINFLTENLQNYVDFKTPEGGMALWAKFKQIDLLSLKPVINELGLHMDIDPELSQKYNAMRIGFASITENEMDEALILLQRGIKQISS